MTETPTTEAPEAADVLPTLPTARTTRRPVDQVPAEMRAVRHTTYGAPAEALSVETVPTPEAEAGEVLVRVEAAAINPADWHHLTGTPYLVRSSDGLRRPKDPRLGVDFAGCVVGVGAGVASVDTGDEVFGWGTGALAEYLTVPAEQVTSKPPGMTFTDASTLGIAAFTALQAIRDKGEVAAGQRVLINGAAGGVGPFAVQLAKAAGAHVTAVCSTRNVEMVEGCGADTVIDYTTDDYAAVDEPYDVIVDNVGNRRHRTNRACIAGGGRYVLISGPKDAKVLGPMGYMLRGMVAYALRPQTFVFFIAEETAADLEELRRLAADGTLSPVVERTYGLDEIVDAYDYLATGHARAKLVITP